MIIHGDCIEEMRKLDKNSVDAIVTDPPYGIGFMGKEWDNFKPSAVQKAMDNDKRPKTGIASTRTSNFAGTYDLSITGSRKYQDWCYNWAKECLRILKPGGYLLCSNSTRMYHRMACAKLNRKFIGIEKEEEYVKIAKARIKSFEEQERL